MLNESPDLHPWGVYASNILSYDGMVIAAIGACNLITLSNFLRIFLKATMFNELCQQFKTRKNFNQ